MTKPLTTITFSLAIILCFLSHSVFAANNEPSTNTIKDFSDMSRYAFITDTKKPHIAVVDTINRQKISTLTIAKPADIIAISNKGGFLAYAQKEENIIYFLDLATLKETKKETSHSIKEIIIDNSGQWVSYSGTNTITVLNRTIDKTTTYPLQGKLSLLHHATNPYLYVAEMEYGKLHKIDLKSQRKEVLFELNTSMSPISIMPNGIALFFVADNIIQRYSLLDEKIIPLNIKAAQYRPYISSDSRNIFALSDTQPQQLLAINAYTYALKQKYALPHWQLSQQKTLDFMITGWLERVAILFDDTSMYSLDIDNPNSLKKQSTESSMVHDMLVQSDSKTLLFTKNKSNKLFLFDIKKQQFLDAIELDLGSPNHILMGETNTLCH